MLTTAQPPAQPMATLSLKAAQTAAVVVVVVVVLSLGERHGGVLQALLSPRQAALLLQATLLPHKSAKQLPRQQPKRASSLPCVLECLQQAAAAPRQVHRHRQRPKHCTCLNNEARSLYVGAVLVGVPCCVVGGAHDLLAVVVVVGACNQRVNADHVAVVDTLWEERRAQWRVCSTLRHACVPLCLLRSTSSAPTHQTTAMWCGRVSAGGIQDRRGAGGGGAVVHTDDETQLPNCGKVSASLKISGDATTV